MMKGGDAPVKVNRMLLMTTILFILFFIGNLCGTAHPAMIISSAASGGTTPTLTSATLDGWGTSLTLVFSESVSVGAGGNGGWTIDMNDATGETLTYASGSGSNTLVYTVNRHIHSGATGTIAYTQPGNGIEATTGGNDLANIASAAVTNNSTLYVAQNFEGTGYDNGETWTEETDGTAPNEDYTTTVLRGSQSLYLAEGAGNYAIAQKGFTSSTSIYVFFRIRITSSAALANYVIISNDAGGSTINAGLQISATGTCTLIAGSGSSASCGTLSDNTTYYVWLDYTKGTGSNGIARIYIDTDNTQPAATASITNSNSTTNAVYLTLVSESNNTVIFDQVYVSSAAIGDVPN